MSTLYLPHVSVVDALANLAWTSPVVAALPAAERSALAQRLEIRFFERGDRLAVDGVESEGLYFILSGEVAVAIRAYGACLAASTLKTGGTVGAVEFVLRQRSCTDAVATRATATLFLSREAHGAVVQNFPSLLSALYTIAIRRAAETRMALEARPVPALMPSRAPAIDRARDARALAVRPASVPQAALSLRPVSSAPPVQSPPASNWWTLAGAALGASTASLVTVAVLTSQNLSLARGDVVGASVTPPRAAETAAPGPRATTPEAPVATPVQVTSAGTRRTRLKTRPSPDQTAGPSPTGSTSAGGAASSAATVPLVVTGGAVRHAPFDHVVSSAEDFGGRE
jgi:CRP-like cAMP-binding protein